jgi:nitrogen fixation NifU-like protein
MSDDIYQNLIMDHFKNPRNVGKIKAPGVRFGRAANTVCGDSVDVFLIVEDGVVAEVSAMAAGCAICKASASIMTEAVKDRVIEDVEEIMRRVWQLIQEPGEIPEVEGDLMALGQLREYPMRQTCGLVAWKALRDALWSECTTTPDHSST